MAAAAAVTAALRPGVMVGADAGTLLRAALALALEAPDRPAADAAGTAAAALLAKWDSGKHTSGTRVCAAHSQHTWSNCNRPPLQGRE